MSIRESVSLALVMSLVSSCAWSFQLPSRALCHAPETTYFSCETSRHKSISLCGTLPGDLQYRYGTGTPGELRFPQQASNGPRQLLYAHYSRYQTDRSEVTFRRVGTDYAVFDYTENGQRSAGVHVTTADRAGHELRCAGPIRGQLLPLGKSLRCDSDSALNGGQCP
jgi:hypothetical protein